MAKVGVTPTSAFYYNGVVDSSRFAQLATNSIGFLRFLGLVVAPDDERDSDGHLVAISLCGQDTTLRISPRTQTLDIWNEFTGTQPV